MKTPIDPLDAALQARSSRELRDALGPKRPDLGPSLVARLSSRLRSFGEPRRELRLAIVRSYSTELLRPYLELEALLGGSELALHEAPYGVLAPEGDEARRLAEHRPDLLVAFLRAEDLSPALAAPLSLIPADERSLHIRAAIDRLATILTAIRSAVAGPIVITLLPRFGEPELGGYDAMVEDSEAALCFELKRSVGELLRTDFAGVLLHDIDTLVEDLGRRRVFDARLWHSTRFPFASEGAHHLVRRLFAFAAPLAEPPAKCIVVDADDTLWGGVVGEDGPEGIELGPEYPGSLFVEFQRRLAGFQRRGLLLAMVSRNNREDVLEILRSHPHQVLRESHFAALEVGWDSKVDALRRVAASLDIGTDALVYVDDSPHECLAVRSQMPEVTVVQAPRNPVDLPSCLDELDRLELRRLTDEDRRRPALYVEQSERRRLQAAAKNGEDYLESLGMVMTIRENDRATAPRIAQLAQKTNQFNLTSIRYGEAEILALMASGDAVVLCFSLADVLGDSGIVGATVVRRITAEAPEVDAFFMSCRVIGRRAEIAFLGALLDVCAERGVRRLVASYAPTAKNQMVRDFWPQNRFRKLAENRYERDLAAFDSLREPAIMVRRELPAAERTEATQ